MPVSQLDETPDMAELLRHLAGLIREKGGEGEWHTFSMNIRVDGDQVWMHGESLVVGR